MNPTDAIDDVRPPYASPSRRRSPGRLGLRVVCLAILAASASPGRCGGDEPPTARVTRNACGRNALMLVCNYLGVQVDPREWEERLPAAAAPFSLHDLRTAAENVGLEVELIEWTDQRTADLNTPCILYVRAPANAAKSNHFIACFGMKGDSVCVCEYPSPPALVPRDHLLTVWDGTAMYVTPRSETGAVPALPMPTPFAEPWVRASIAGAVVLLAGWSVILSRRRIARPRLPEQDASRP